MKTGFGCIMALALLAGSDGVCRADAAPEPADQDAWVRMDLADGSLLVGTNGLQVVALETEYATLAVPARDIKLATFDAPSSRTTLLMRNDDKLTGRLAVRKWPLSTRLGDLSVDVGLITRIAFSARDMSALKGLVLWNGLGSPQEVQNSFVGPGGTVRGNVQFVSGKEGDGAQIKGAGGILFPPESLRGFGQPTTFELWLKIPEADGLQKMVMWCCQDMKSAGMYVLLSPEQKLVLNMSNSSGDSFIEPCQVTGPLGSGEWHHVAIAWDVINTIDGTDTVRVYLDGNLVFHTSVKPRGAPNSFKPVEAHLNFILGCQGYKGKIDDSVFTGVVDELRVWDHVVTNFPRATGMQAR